MNAADDVQATCKPLTGSIVQADLDVWKQKAQQIPSSLNWNHHRYDPTSLLAPGMLDLRAMYHDGRADIEQVNG